MFKNEKKIVAIVPTRKGSQRVKNKNTKSFSHYKSKKMGRQRYSLHDTSKLGFTNIVFLWSSS